MLLVANLANTIWCKKNLEMTETLSARAFQWIPTWHSLDGFLKYLHPCSLDESSFNLSIGRVNLMVFISDVCISSYTCSRTREECSDENASPRFLTTRWRPLSRRTFAVLLLAADTDAPSKDSFNARLTSAASRPGRCSRNSRWDQKLSSGSLIFLPITLILRICLPNIWGKLVDNVLFNISPSNISSTRNSRWDQKLSSVSLIFLPITWK